MNTYSYDYTVNIHFWQETESHKLYGDYLTGVLVFTQKERITYEEHLNTDPITNTDGQVKIRVLSLSYNEELKQKLIQEGFTASHVCNVESYMKPSENHFVAKEVRKLPKPLEIKINRGTDEEGERMMMGMFSSMIERGNKLTPFETTEYRGYLYKYHKEKLPESVIKSDFTDPKTGNVKQEIMYHVLSSDYNNEKLNKEQSKAFEDIIEKMQDEKIILLKTELNGTQESLKKLAKDYPDAFNIIIKILPHFKPKRLLHGKIPIYLDIKGFIHIFVRHVSETQIGAKNKNEKSPFQYAFHEILELLEAVVKSVDGEIEKHFTENPDKDFVRKGDNLIYYQGDYFYLHILASGRVSTFYKNILRE